MNDLPDVGIHDPTPIGIATRDPPPESLGDAMEATSP
jgi:hypothetical protein